MSDQPDALRALRTNLRTLGISLPEETERLLETYLRELDHWNRAMNLTSLTCSTRIRHLIAEPLWVARQLSPTGRYLDIGSGNGSPAIPWHLACGFTSATLVEARQRRATFLRRLVGTLEHSEIVVEHGRFEEIAPALEPPDWVTLQGVRLEPELFAQIRSVSQENTRLVWLTRSAEVPAPPQTCLAVPRSDRRALVFRFHKQEV